jgi:polyhydroxyalkanoate synthesis regulator phasin
MNEVNKGTETSSNRPSILEVVREGFLQTLGRITVSREAAEAAVQRTVNRLVELGKMTQEEAKSFSNEVRGRIEKNKNELERRIDDGVSNAMAAVRFPRREDLDALRARVAELEQLIRDLESRTTTH